MSKIRVGINFLQNCIGRLNRSLFFSPFLVCMSILVATGFGWQAARDSLQHDVREAANTRIMTLEQSLSRHLVSYEQILRGGVGLFQGSTEVTNEEWSNYLAAYGVAKNYPSVQSIGYAKVLTYEELADTAAYLANQGITNFHIHPIEPKRDVYAVPIYVQAIAAPSGTAYGFDMYSEPLRQKAMLQARDTTDTTITGRLSLQATGNPVGFNMYTPHYESGAPTTVDERRATLRGYVFASFRADTFFQDIMTESAKDDLGFLVTVKSQLGSNTLYKSNSFDSRQAHDDGVHITRSFAVYGQTWNMQYALDPHQLVSKVQLARPGGVIFFGVFSAALIGTIVFLLLRSRSRALAAQKDRDVELAKEELLSLASHQLRTPATGVKQYLGMVLQGFAGPMSAKQKPLLEKAYASNDRQLQAINEILHMAKIDSGRIVLARQDTDLTELLADIAGEQRPDIKNANHTLKLKLPKRHIFLHVDTHMLRMAIENLLSNAIKYTPGGGHITVELRSDDNNVHIAIADNGVGIDTADFSKLFKQFTRLPNEMSQRVSGTGVGLYLAKHLVALHHGSISVRSELGKGATFTIILPIEPNKIEERI